MGVMFVTSNAWGGSILGGGLAPQPGDEQGEAGAWGLANKGEGFFDQERKDDFF